jgi:arylsulfatase A-like enzyme
MQAKFRNQGYKNKNLITENDWKKIIRNYWGLVTQVDLSVGEILKTVDNLGLDDNTIVIYTSDHGDMMGAHRMITKTVMYEEVIKVPWIMRLPQMRSSQHVIKNRVSHIDLIPTILDLMGKKDDGQRQGKSIVPLIRGDVKQNDNVFLEWNPKRMEPDTLPLMPNVSQAEVDRVLDASIRTVITQDGWKLCWSDKDKNQLFDLSKDPLETHNLYYIGEFEHIIKRLQKDILEWQKQTGDRLVL